MDSACRNTFCGYLSALMKYAAPLAALLASCADTTAPTHEPPLAAISEHTLGLRDELIALRRDIHQNPELSGSESETAARIAAKLGAIGRDVRTRVGGHGVIGILRGALAGPVVAVFLFQPAEETLEGALLKSAAPGPG